MGGTDQFFPLHQIRLYSYLHTVENRSLARELALRWTLPRRADGSFNWASLPSAAVDGDVLEVQLPRGPISVLQSAGTGLWLMRRDFADSKVEGRIWRHEIFVGEDNSADVIGVRTSVVLGRNMVSPNQRPSVIAAFTRNCHLLDATTSVQIKPRAVTLSDAAPVLDLLASPDRTLPVLFLNRSIGGRTPLDAEAAAEKLAGFAHVLVVMPDAAATVGRYLDKEMGLRLDDVSLCWPAAAHGAIHESWDLIRVKEQRFWPTLETGIVRSSANTTEAWLGPLADRLMK